jgi:metal-responsive CopG/Arc/MetJ family transcriptional regulator
MSLTTVRLPDHMVHELDEVAERRHTTRSEIIREAVEQYCATARSGQEIDPVLLVRRLVTYDGSGRGDLARRGEEYLREMFCERRRTLPF